HRAPRVHRAAGAAGTGSRPGRRPRSRSRRPRAARPRRTRPAGAARRRAQRRTDPRAAEAGRGKAERRRVAGHHGAGADQRSPRRGMTVAETFFLASVAAYLAGAHLVRAPALIGVTEPAQPIELPAIVLSLETTSRANPGVGGGAELAVGVLPTEARIDLTNPVLPDEPTFSLLDATRRTLILPHGGLVKQDGSDPGDLPLAAADITVTVANTPRTVVACPPGANEVRADGRIGVLSFGAPLPAIGLVRVTYFLGQWERRLERIAGTLRVDVCALAATDVAAISDAAIESLLAPAARREIPRLLAIAPVSLGSIGVPEPAPALRRRSGRLAFTVERGGNRAEASGGIIDPIAATSPPGGRP